MNMMEGTEVPFFVKFQSAMIQKDIINQSIETFLSNIEKLKEILWLDSDSNFY